MECGGKRKHYSAFLVYTGARPKETKSLYEKRRSRFALLICDSGAGWSRQVDNFKAPEAYFATPLFKISGRIIECFAEFDEHVERHEQAEDIVAARVIDQRFDDNERAARLQRIVGSADELHLSSPGSNRAGSFPL